MTNSNEVKANSFKVTYQPKNFDGLKPFGGKAKATPRPWIAAGKMIFGSGFDFARSVAEVGTRQDASFIVKAVNEYDDLKKGLSELAQEVKSLANQRDALLEACRDAKKFIELNTEYDSASASTLATIDALNQAIQQAEGR